MKANKIRLQSSRVQSTRYPGGGMLRNKYADGGAVKKPVPIGKAIGDAVRRNPKLMQMSGMQAIFGAPQAAMASRARTYAAPAKATTAAKATTTTAPSRAASVMPSSMAQSRPAYVPPGGGSKPTAQRAAAPTTAKTASSSGSFSKAFADARAKGLKEFTWNGKKYTTQIKGGATAKPQATRNAEPVSKMPMKAVASVTKPYFESPTGVMQPASVKTTEMRGAAVQKMPMKPATSVQASTDKGNQYFKPGTMAEYLEERRRKMQSNLMTKR